MAIMKWERSAPIDLWDAFEGLRGEMDRALETFRVPDAAGIFDPSGSPAVDVAETEEEFLVMADIPGMEKRDIEVSVTGTLLSIKGDKKDEPEINKRKFLRHETWAGKFRRTINLPSPIDAEKVAAELKDGVLTIRIGKREEAKTKLISVAVK